MDIIKVFYDVETTGTNVKKHSLHQNAGLIEINDEVVEEFNIKSRPHPKAEYTEAAMRICHVTEQELKAYQSMGAAYREFTSILDKYIDKHDPKNKAFLIGYVNLSFDDNFLRTWFEQNGDFYINSYFWAGSIDCIALAAQYLLHRRFAMSSFKLHRVAKTLGLEVEKEKLHDASYDVHLTRQIYRIVTGLEIEL